MVLVHQCHCTLRLFPTQSGEELQGQTHVDGHKNIGGVHHHGHHGEQDCVEDGLLPGLQDIDARDQEVLVVQPAHVLPHVLHIHASVLVYPRAKKWSGGGWRDGTRKGTENNKCYIKDVVMEVFSL